MSIENRPKSADMVWEVLGIRCFISPDGFGDGTAGGGQVDRLQGASGWAFRLTGRYREKHMVDI